LLTKLRVKLRSVGKGGALEAAEKRLHSGIVSEAKNLALNLFKAVRDSSSPAAPRNDRQRESSHRLRSPALPRCEVMTAISAV